MPPARRATRPRGTAPLLDPERGLRELLDVDDLTHGLGRRICSVLLARMLRPLDWDAAARYLDLPGPFTNDAYNLTFAKLRSTDQFIELANRVKRIANRHARRGLIDYKQRRASLPERKEIDITS